MLRRRDATPDAQGMTRRARQPREARKRKFWDKHGRMASGGHELLKAGVLNLLLTTNYFSIFQVMMIYKLKYGTVFTGCTVLYLLYCTYCTAFIALYLLYLLYILYLFLFST
jgi:hypothetical protein